MEQTGVLMVLSGFSGAGKGTLVKELLRKYDEYALSISMTTRSPRVGEVPEHLVRESGMVLNISLRAGKNLKKR